MSLPPNTGPVTAAVGGSLSFAKSDSGTQNDPVSSYMADLSVVQPDGSLSVTVQLKLAVEGQVNPQTAFVNVLLYSKIDGVPKIFEIRKSRDELTYLVNYMGLTDPKAGQVLRNASNVVTHVRFDFNNVLLPVVLVPGELPTLPNDVIGINAYEQNNGSTNSLIAGKNYCVGYQISTPLGTSIPIAAEPGKPRLEILTKKIVSNPAGNGLLYVSASLRLYLPSFTGGGGVALKSYNIYMLNDSDTSNGVVAQLLNVLFTDPNQTYIDIEAGIAGNPGLGYDSVKDNDTVSFIATVDNVLNKESVISDAVYFRCSLKAPAPVITGFTSAEIQNSISSTYNNPNDVPGVKFTFQADLAATWNYVTLWAKPVGAAIFRASQQWRRSGDVSDQLSGANSCSKIWNQKWMTTLATSGADSVSSTVLPALTAFDIYLTLSENADIAAVGSFGNGDANVVFGQLSVVAGAIRATQSNNSIIKRVITSIVRPQQCVVYTVSNITEATPAHLTLTNHYNTAPASDLPMPSSHLDVYYTNIGIARTLSNRVTLKAVDQNNDVVYDGALSSYANSKNSKSQPLTGGQYIPSISFPLVNTTSPPQWTSEYAFSFKNMLLINAESTLVSVIQQSSPENLSSQSLTSLVTINSETYFSFFQFSSITPVRTRPSSSTILPSVFIKNAQESRLLSGGTGSTAAYGSLQIATTLQLSQSHISQSPLPYTWNQLIIETATNEGFSTNLIQTTLTSSDALSAEILYLCNTSGGTGNNVVAPQKGAAPGTVFPGFTAGGPVFIRLQLRYTWNGAVNATSPYNTHYDSPYFGKDANTAYYKLDIPVTPITPPSLSNMTVGRARAYKLTASVPQPETMVYLVAGQASTKITYTGMKFQLVDTLNNPVSIPLVGGGDAGVIVLPYTNTAAGVAQIATFTIPETRLDQYYSVVATASYKNFSNDIVFSPPLRSSDVFFENIPIFMMMGYTETNSTFTCTATIDLGAIDRIIVNTTDAHVAPTLTAGFYVENMFLSCLVPASINSNEVFAHKMTFTPDATGGTYTTGSLLKVKNDNLYGKNATFIVVANNNSGISLGMYPKLNANAANYNINTIVQ